MPAMWRLERVQRRSCLPLSGSVGRQFGRHEQVALSLHGCNRSYLGAGVRRTRVDFRLGISRQLKGAASSGSPTATPMNQPNR